MYAILNREYRQHSETGMNPKERNSISDRLLPEHFNDIEVVAEVTLKLLLK